MIECTSAYFFIFRLEFDFFVIKIRIPKPTSKLTLKKSQYLEKYKKKLQIMAKRIEYLIKYTMVCYKSTKNERIRTNR